MSNQKAQLKPKCCGEVVRATISPAIEYWFCRGCKKEIQEESPSVSPWRAEEDKNFAKELEEFEKFLAGSLGSQKDDDDQLITLVHKSTTHFGSVWRMNASPIPVARTGQDVERIAAEAREYADRISPNDVF